VLLFRVLPWDESADADDQGGALWIPRDLQGPGRHDNPEHYGALYVARDAICAVAERLAAFRTQSITDEHLYHSGYPLAIAEIDLADGQPLVDLDDPEVLVSEGFRPSLVATMHRDITQQLALDLFQRHRAAVGFSWWSTMEATLQNVTLYDRGLSYLSIRRVGALSLDDTVVQDAMGLLGLVRALPRPARTGVRRRRDR
jgi:RES domain-containing protein